MKVMCNIVYRIGKCPHPEGGRCVHRKPHEVYVESPFWGQKFSCKNVLCRYNEVCTEPRTPEEKGLFLRMMIDA